MAERIRALWQRLLADIHRNPGLWIGVGISAVILVVAYLAYRRQQNSQMGQVPANGYGWPDYGSATGGSGGGTMGGGYNPYQPNLSFVPNPGSSQPPVPPVAVPPVPSFNFNPPPVSTPSNPFKPASRGGSERAVGGIASGRHRGGSERAVGGIASGRHRGGSERAVGGIAHGRHQGVSERAVGGIAHMRHPQGYHVPIPTTQRPRTVTGRGRVA